MKATILLVAVRGSPLIVSGDERPVLSVEAAREAARRSRRAASTMPRILAGLLMIGAAACSADLGTGVESPSATPQSAGPVAPGSEAGALPPVRPDSVIFGIQGHPLVRSAYSLDGRTIGEQFDYLDSLRVQWYRVDAVPDSDGTLDPKFLAFVQAAASRGIHVLPVITTWPRSRQSPAEAYAEALRIGEGFALRYGKLFTHVEAGNEFDAWALLSGSGGAADGSDLGQYDADTLAVVAAYLRGMTRGLRAGAPNLRIIINSSGWHHWAFFDALQRDSVDYDIVGYHWYSDMGDIDAPVAGGESVLDHLHDLNKDIWITEVNGRVKMPYDPREQSHWLYKYIRDFYRFSRVKAIFVYELYEEREFLADANPSNDAEAFYGLVACPADPVGCTGEKELKPAFDAYRFGIEEQLHGHEDYVASLYVHLIGRVPDAGGLAHWTSVFRSSNERDALIREFIPADNYYERFVLEQYDRLLGYDSRHGNAPLSSDVAHWAAGMRAGLSRRQVTVELSDSPDFLALSGQTNTGYVQRLYRTLLRREAEPDDVSYWVGQLDGGMTRGEVAARLLDSDEFHGLFVDAQYRALLDRPSDGPGRAHWVEQMRNGASQEDVILELLNSAEFWWAAVRAGHRSHRPASNL